jgi:putative endonuclease
VDLVCEDDGVLCFVEVRSRTGDEHGGPEESVDRRKARRVIRAATDWAARHDALERETRFDVVAVTFGPEGPGFALFQGAFDGDGEPGLT